MVQSTRLVECSRTYGWRVSDLMNMRVSGVRSETGRGRKAFLSLCEVVQPSGVQRSERPFFRASGQEILKKKLGKNCVGIALCDG
jgi:hypothetical protein